MSLTRYDQDAARALALYSPAMFRVFARVFRSALRRDFHAFRLSRTGPAPAPATERLIVYCNHPSWWDAVAFILLAERLFSGRPGFAPIEAAMLRQYRFLARVGAFGIETEGFSGAAAFLATSRRILEHPNGLLLVTGQGQFTDSRQRPIQLRPGLAHLARIAPAASFVPLALDYVFWNERRPELLVRFGAPIPAATLAGLPVASRTAMLAEALEATMDALAAEAMARDPAKFDVLLAGREGVGGVYDLWRRMRAGWKGERFSAAHGGS